MNTRGFIRELRQRHVFRVSAVYVAVAFVVLQAASLLTDALPLPGWVPTLFTVVLILGFPIAAVLAWAFELTPEGVRWVGPARRNTLTPHRQNRAGTELQARAAEGRHLWMGLGLVVLVLALALGVGARDRLGMMSHETEFDPSRVAVQVLDNQTGDTALTPLGRMAADWIAQGLVESGLVEVVDKRTRLDPNSRSDSQPEPAEGAELAVARAVSAEPGRIISGTYYQQEGRIQFQARLTEAQDGKVLRVVDAAAPRQAPLEAIDMLRRRVTAAVAALSDPLLASYGTNSSQPAVYEAYLEFAQGMERLLRQQYRSAIDNFDRALSVDSTFALAALTAADAHLALGQLVQADSLTRQLERLRDELPPLDRHHLDRLRAELVGDRAGALQAALDGLAVAAEPPLYYQGALAAHRAGRPGKAVELLQELGSGEAATADWHRYFGLLTAAYHALGEHGKELRAARRARRRYPELGVALFYEARALIGLGHIQRVEDLLSELSTLPLQPPLTVGDMLRATGRELLGHGYADDASKVLGRAISWYQQLPGKEGVTPAARDGFLRTLYVAGRLAEADSVADELTASPLDSAYTDWVWTVEREIDGEVGGAAWGRLGHTGVIAARLGRTDEASRVGRKLERLDEPLARGMQRYWQARIAAALGDRERAVTLLREAFAAGLMFGTYLHCDVDLMALREDGAAGELLWARP